RGPVGAIRCRVKKGLTWRRWAKQALGRLGLRFSEHLIGKVRVERGRQLYKIFAGDVVPLLNLEIATNGQRQHPLQGAGKCFLMRRTGRDRRRLARMLGITVDVKSDVLAHGALPHSECERFAWRRRREASSGAVVIDERDAP